MDALRAAAVELAVAVRASWLDRRWFESGRAAIARLGAHAMRGERANREATLAGEARSNPPGFLISDRLLAHAAHMVEGRPNAYCYRCLGERASWKPWGSAPSGHPTLDPVEVITRERQKTP